jgi:hypothetical protein
MFGFAHVHRPLPWVRVSAIMPAIADEGMSDL